jgi:hypothetical protein
LASHGINHKQNFCRIYSLFYFFQLIHHRFVYLMIEKIIHLASVVMVKLKASSMKNYVSLKDT